MPPGVPPATVEEARRSLDRFIAWGLESFVDASKELEARPGDREVHATCLDLALSLDAMMRLRHSLARTRRPVAGTVR